MLIGYARVSTREQETTMQLDALQAAGAQQIFQEKASSVGSRPELEKCLDMLQEGDVLMVYKLDRVARSLMDLLSILDRIRDAGAKIKSLNEPLDTTSPIGVFVVQVLGSVAQLERSIIRERVISGQVAAIKRGGKHGRPRLLTEEQIADARTRRAAGETILSIARSFGVSKGCIERAVKPHLPRFQPHRPVLGPLLQH